MAGQNYNLLPTRYEDLNAAFERQYPFSSLWTHLGATTRDRIVTMRKALDRCKPQRQKLWLGPWKMSQEQLIEQFSGKVLGQGTLLLKLVELMETGISKHAALEPVSRLADLRRRGAEGWSVKSVKIDILFCSRDIERAIIQYKETQQQQ